MGLWDDSILCEKLVGIGTGKAMGKLDGINRMEYIQKYFPFMQILRNGGKRINMHFKIQYYGCDMCYGKSRIRKQTLCY
jgi:hypothetical protein